MPWLPGPLPADTYNFGGVIPDDMPAEDDGFFYFADFRGDHVVCYPGGRRLRADRVKYYNNDVTMPPTAPPPAEAGAPVRGGIKRTRATGVPRKRSKKP